MSTELLNLNSGLVYTMPSILRKEKKIKSLEKEKAYRLRYSFEILDILWKERSKCSAGIKQNASEKQYFSW